MQIPRHFALIAGLQAKPATLLAACYAYALDLESPQECINADYTQLHNMQH